MYPADSRKNMTQLLTPINVVKTETGKKILIFFKTLTLIDLAYHTSNNNINIITSIYP